MDDRHRTGIRHGIGLVAHYTVPTTGCAAAAPWRAEKLIFIYGPTPSPCGGTLKAFASAPTAISFYPNHQQLLCRCRLLLRRHVVWRVVKLRLILALMMSELTRTRRYRKNRRILPMNLEKVLACHCAGYDHTLTFRRRIGTEVAGTTATNIRRFAVFSPSKVDKLIDGPLRCTKTATHHGLRYPCPRPSATRLRNLLPCWPKNHRGGNITVPTTALLR